MKRKYLLLGTIILLSMQTACGSATGDAVEIPDVSAMLAQKAAEEAVVETESEAVSEITITPIEEADTWFKFLSTASINDKKLLDEDGLKIVCKGWQPDTLNENSYVAACELEITNTNTDNKKAQVIFSDCIYINGFRFEVRPEDRNIVLLSGEKLTTRLFAIDPQSYETMLSCYGEACNSIPLESVEFVFSTRVGEFIDSNEVSDENPVYDDKYITIYTDLYRPSDLSNLYGDKLYLKEIDDNPIAIYAKRCGDGITATLVNTSENPVFLSSGIAKDKYNFEVRTTWSVNGLPADIGDDSINNMHHGPSYDYVETLYPGGSLVFNFTESAAEIHRQLEIPDNEALTYALEFTIYISRYHDSDSLGLITIPIANIMGTNDNIVVTYLLDDSLAEEDEIL